jgi:hypothetical protein
MTPPRLLTGKDLIALGNLPGPRFKVILTRWKKDSWKGNCAPEEALAWVERHVHR